MRRRSIIATPPGATIKEQLNDRGMSQKEFAARMDMSEKHISKLINGDVQLTPETAIRLEMVLGVPAKFWNNLEAIYREKIIKAKAENAMDADADMARQFPYNEMARFGWVFAFPVDLAQILWSGVQIRFGTPIALTFTTSAFFRVICLAMIRFHAPVCVSVISPTLTSSIVV